MLAIRLQRIGKKNRPSYRVVISEKSRDLYGKQLEILGNYDPVAQPKVIKLDAERIKHWLSEGAQPSATVHNILVSQSIIEGKKVRSWKPKKKAAAEGADKKESKPEAPKAKEAPAENKTPEEKKEKPATPEGNKPE